MNTSVRCPECLQAAVLPFDHAQIGICSNCGAKLAYCDRCHGNGVIDDGGQTGDCPECQGTGLQLLDYQHRFEVKWIRKEGHGMTQQFENELIALAEKHGYTHTGGPTHTTSKDSTIPPSLIPHEKCPNCIALGYYTQLWQASTRLMFVHYCDHCGYRWFEIEV